CDHRVRVATSNDVLTPVIRGCLSRRRSTEDAGTALSRQGGRRMVIPTSRGNMAGVRDALAACSSGTRRVVTEEVLAVPAVQHMLSTFLADSSRSFEDWIREPRCWHSLTKLSDRIDSADGPAVTANYEEQYALAGYERLRASTSGWGNGVGGAAASAAGGDAGAGPLPEGAVQGAQADSRTTSPLAANGGNADHGGDEATDGKQETVAAPHADSAPAAAATAAAVEGAETARDAAGVVNEVWHVRHGKPGRKTLEIFDPALTGEGHVQASAAGLYLSTLPFNRGERRRRQQQQQQQPGEGFDVVYTSPLARAVQTAVCLSRALGDLPLEVVPGLCSCTAALVRRGGFPSVEAELMTDGDIAEAFPGVAVRPRDPLAPTTVAEAGEGGGGGAWAYELHDLLASTGKSLGPRGREPSSYARPLGTAAATPEDGENGSWNGDDGAAAEALAGRVMALTVSTEGSKLGAKGNREGARELAGAVGGGITAAPAASPWPLGVEVGAPAQHVSRSVPAVGSETEGGAGWQGQEQEGEENADAEEEMVFDTLMVMSEAMKEEGKAKFQRGDYMGAAKAYRRAAEALDERAAPTADRLEPLRTRLRTLYEKCMCNAAVAGFKAAAASPAPGEAHSLVVDTCSKALTRCGGRCPKAAEAPQETEKSKSYGGGGGGGLVANGPAPAPDDAATPSPNGTSLSPNGTSPPPNGSSSLPPNGTPSPPNGTGTNPTAITNSTVSGGVGSASAVAEGNGDGKAKSRPSEAARWLAVVRAKIADVSAARALAAEQASAREENAAAGRQRALEVAQRRARYGPGHVPRPPPASTEEGETGEEDDADAEGAVTGDSSERGKKAQEDVVSGWKVPRPPPLKVPNRSPAMVLNDYAMQARFQAPADYEQVTGEDGQAEYLCTISVGPEDRIVGRGRAPNMKAAKQQASRELLTNAALAWNEENPEDPIDMETMVPLPAEAVSKKPKAAVTEITEEFKAYCAAWVDKVVSEDVHEACFPDGIDKGERK
ncbi:unnamed protein product, partial [Ectocarpus sp. 8 AP-2014]